MDLDVADAAAAYLHNSGIDDEILETKLHEDPDQVNIIVEGSKKYTVSYRMVGNRLELWREGYPPEHIEQDIPAVDLEKLTVKELRQLAETAGVKGYSKMHKTDLILALMS
jgi:hypothetical protein